MSHQELLPTVSQTLASPVTRISRFRRDPLEYDVFLGGRSLSRLHGTAVLSDEDVSWSFIEKVTERPGIASDYLYDGGMRELLAYRSGLLDDLAPGFSAPIAYALTEHDDGTLTLWLEDLVDSTGRDWSRRDYLTAARHLGRLAGRWLDRVPEYPWLFDGWIERHSQLDAIAGGAVTVHEGIRHSDAVNRIGLRLVEDGPGLIHEQPRFRAALKQLPQTLCHHDAVRANLFTRVQKGVPETVAIDWEMVGPGAIGADIASLLFSSVRRGDLSARRASSLKPQVLEAYAQGMVDVEAAVDPRDIRLGFAASVSLRWSLLRDVLVALTTPTARVFRGGAMDEPPDAALAELVALTGFLFDAAVEARGLADGLSG